MISDNKNIDFSVFDAVDYWGNVLCVLFICFLFKGYWHKVIVGHYKILSIHIQVFSRLNLKDTNNCFSHKNYKT